MIPSIMNKEIQQPQNQTKPKQKAKIEHLLNWYHGNFCVKHKHCTREHYEDAERIALAWNIQAMTHKEFIFRMRQELKCSSIKREFLLPYLQKIGCSTMEIFKQI